jgi:hypothetical protein
MMIQGCPNLTHVVREFFLCEYAFEINWFERPAIRIAHRKGVWVLAKVEEDDTFVEAFEIDDFGCYPALVFSQPSGLIRGFLDAKLAKKPLSLAERSHVAHALTDLIHFWGGPIEEIRMIQVVQPGRNAYLTDKGEFDLSPQPDSWKK